MLHLLYLRVLLPKSIVIKVEQVGVDDVGRDTYDTKVLENEGEDVGQVGGSDTRYDAHIERQVTRPVCVHVTCSRRLESSEAPLGLGIRF